MLTINFKKYNIIDLISFFFYFESNCLLISSKLGFIKLKLFDSLCFYIDDWLLTNIRSSFIKHDKFNFYIYLFFNKLSNIFKSIIYGFDIKYKVIGLGHRGYYSKNLYLYKIGYSHLVFCFLPIGLKAKKKKKKKMYHKLYSINSNLLSNIFYHLQNMRVPDIYSKNGIYNRTDYYEFKKGKKSFMM